VYGRVPAIPYLVHPAHTKKEQKKKKKKKRPDDER
jgi:hypothetical protein